MTDLERAQAVLHEVSLARSPVKAMVAILAAARREGAEAAEAKVERAREKAYAHGFRRGAEEMRERAAQEFRMAAKAADTREDVVLARRYRLVASIVASLPLTPEEPT